MTKTKIISLIIIFAGILGAFAINSRFSSEKTSLTRVTATKREEGSNLNFRTSPITQPLPLSQNIQNGVLNNNLTEAFAQSYLQEIFKRNPNGPQILDNEQMLAIPSEQAFSDLLQNYLESSFVWIRFETKDIKISADNSRASKLKYIEFIRSLMQKKKENIEGELTALNDFLEKQKTDDLYASLSSIREDIGELLKNPVPSSNKFFHLQVLNTWQKQASIYKAVLNLSQDPVKALLATNEITSSTEELRNLSLAIENEYQELKS